MIFCSLVIVAVLSKRRGRALRTPTTPRPASASASAMTPTVRLSLNYCIRTQLVSHQHIGREAVRCGRRIFIFSSVGVGRLRTTAEGDLVPDEGIEPPTFGLQNRCSTAELIRRLGGFCATSEPSRAQGRFLCRPSRDSRRPWTLRGYGFVHAWPGRHGDRDER